MEHEMRSLSCYAVVAMLLFVSGSGYTADEWEVQWLHPTPTAGSIYSMFWHSPTDGWLISTLGEILKTTDGGNTFEIAGNSAWDVQLYDVFFLDSQLGWVVGESGTLVETADGGITWSTTDLGSGDYHGVEFIDENYGTIVGSNNTILRTNNGGVTWTPQGSAVSGYWRDVHFNDVVNGWVTGSSGVINTTTAGAFWELQTGGDFYALDFIDNSTAWAVGTNGLVKYTENGGETWIDASFPEDIDLTDVDFWSSDEGWISGDGFNSTSARCIVYHTIDGGQNWSLDTLITPFSDYNNGFSIFAAGSGQAYWAGEKGLFYSTNDGGSNWEQLLSITVPDDIRDVCFIDTQNGWAAGVDNVIFTTDGGITWEDRSPVMEPTSIFCIYFLDDGVFGWVAGSEGYLARTVNGGLSWTEITTGTSGIILDIAFNSAGFGVLSGWNGLILQSDDYGVTWETPPVSTSNHMRTIEFATESSGFVGGQDGTIFRFDMEGDSWCNLNNPHTYNVSDISAIDENNVWAVIQDGWNYTPTYIASTNGGGTWIRHDIESMNDEFYSIFFSDVNHGCLVTSAYRLAYTVDGGATWQLEYLSAPYVNDSPAFFVDAANAWLPAGNEPGVLKLHGDLTGVAEDETLPLPDMMDQVFVISPNPGLGATQQVTFHTNALFEYILTVHDLSGRMVHSRSLSELGPGEHTVQVFSNAGENVLPSGIYFCAIKGGVSIGHGRFIVLR